MARSRGPLPLVLLALFGTLVGGLLLEAGARVLAVREERRQGRFDRDLATIRNPAPGAQVTLGQVIRRSNDPKIVYELRPRLDVIFAGGRLTTSDSGHRGPDVETPKPSDTLRIVGIGDSYMFGQGVSDDETYMARLPAIMKDDLGGGRVQTVNLAVPGYNTAMEVEMLRTRLDALQADAILIEIVGNDLDLPNFLWNELDPWTLRRSYLFDFVRGRLRARGTNGLEETPQTEGVNASFSRDPEAVPRQYAGMVGVEAFRRSLDELGDMGRARHVPVLAITHGAWFEEDMLQALRKNDIPVLVLRSALRQRARGLGAPDYARSPLAQSERDLHPSALGHRAIAEELARWIRPFVTATPPFAKAG